jgi:hypothetical protein
VALFHVRNVWSCLLNRPTVLILTCRVGKSPPTDVIPLSIYSESDSLGSTCPRTLAPFPMEYFWYVFSLHSCQRDRLIKSSPHIDPSQPPTTLFLSLLLDILTTTPMAQTFLGIVAQPVTGRVHSPVLPRQAASCPSRSILVPTIPSSPVPLKARCEISHRGSRLVCRPRGRSPKCIEHH